MATRSIVATGSQFIEKVCPALGVDPALVKRVILDASFDDIVNVYVEMVGSTKVLNIDFDLADAKVTIVGKSAEGVLTPGERAYLEESIANL